MSLNFCGTHVGLGRTVLEGVASAATYLDLTQWRPVLMGLLQ